MSYGDLKLLLPNRILGIGDDAGAGDDGAGEADGDVRIAGDDLAGVVALTVGVGGEGLSAVECSEETAEALRNQIHIRQTPSFFDFQLQLSVEAYNVVFDTVVRHFFCRGELLFWFARGGGVAVGGCGGVAAAALRNGGWEQWEVS